jgi:TetR/AcrR family transcriptional regulator, transcriptional repressor for nem operon
MLAHGVGATQMEQIAAASGTSKSQLYHHFPDKHALVQAVIELRGQTVLELHTEILANVRSIRGLERWRDVVVGRVASVHGAYGCQLGTIATEIVEDDEQARVSLQGYFRSWEQLISAALDAMVKSGELDRHADPDALAQQVMVALQGGYLLSQLQRSEEPMRRGLDMALDHVRSFRVPRVPPTD